MLKSCDEMEDATMSEYSEADNSSMCVINRDLLEECDGVSDPTFGYSEGQPCIFVKINKVIFFFRY